MFIQLACALTANDRMDSSNKDLFALITFPLRSSASLCCERGRKFDMNFREVNKEHTWIFFRGQLATRDCFVCCFRESIFLRFCCLPSLFWFFWWNVPQCSRAVGFNRECESRVPLFFCFFPIKAWNSYSISFNAHHRVSSVSSLSLSACSEEWNKANMWKLNAKCLHQWSDTFERRKNV